MVYNSEKAKEHIAKSQAAEASVEQGGGGLVQFFASAAASRLALSITVNDLIKGRHIECKDLDELMGAEESIMDGCRILRSYLDTAATFDGREEVIDFGSETAATA